MYVTKQGEVKVAFLTRVRLKPLMESSSFDRKENESF